MSGGKGIQGRKTGELTNREWTQINANKETEGPAGRQWSQDEMKSFSRKAFW